MDKYVIDNLKSRMEWCNLSNKCIHALAGKFNKLQYVLIKNTALISVNPFSAGDTFTHIRFIGNMYQTKLKCNQYADENIKLGTNKL